MSTEEKGVSGVPFYIWLAIALLAFAAAPYLIFKVAGPEPTMTYAQKIFYFHVPSAWSMFLGAIWAGIAGAIALKTRRRRGVFALRACTELTVLFGTMVLFSGPLWARVEWGHYWQWDARLTTLLILYLIFCVVLLVQQFGETGKTVAAGLALFGAVDVPLIYVSVKLWNTIHPKTGVVSSLSTNMRIAFWVSFVAFTGLFFALVLLRMKTMKMADDLDRLHLLIDEAE